METKKKFVDVFLIKNKINKDQRGKFLKINRINKFKSTQSCFSYNSKVGTIRGLHFQKPPYSEVKIITCITGSIFDVVVNINIKSENYLKWKSFILNSKNNESLYIGKDYAHGFQTLENNTILMYEIDQPYKPTLQSGLLWNDPNISIKWPLPLNKISKKDSNFKFLTEILRDKQ
jgi:dTDP-4-dehydrorhamnose 3,5-epimerase